MKNDMDLSLTMVIYYNIQKREIIFQCTCSTYAVGKYIKLLLDENMTNKSV